MKEKGRLNRRVGRYKLICEGVGKVERWKKMGVFGVLKTVKSWVLGGEAEKSCNFTLCY